MAQNSVPLSAMPLFSAEMNERIADALPAARRWADRRLKAALNSHPSPGNVLDGIAAVRMLSDIRLALIAACEPIYAPYSSVRWLWYLRRTNFSVIRGYLPNTATSIMRIAENISGMSRRPPADDTPIVGVPLTFAVDHAAISRIARLLAAAELVNHAEGWLRRSSKNAKFEMIDGGFPDLVEDEQLEAAIEVFDERVVEAANHRWHPTVVPFTGVETVNEPLLIDLSMFMDGVGQTPMWTGRIADKPTWILGEGRFSFKSASLTDQSNAHQLRGSLEAMEHPELVAGLVVFSQALMWHATWYAENIGVSFPRVGYVLMRLEDLYRPISDVLALANEKVWPAMAGFIPRDAAAVIAALESVEEGGVIGAAGPVLRFWQNGVVMVDAFALGITLTERLRMAPSTGGKRVNIIAADFELAVQAVVDSAGLTPRPEVAALRGKTLRLAGASVTDVDAFMEVDGVLVCISCKKFELNRVYDAGDYVSVRNAKSKVEAAVTEWSERLATFAAHPVGDNYDFSKYERVVGLVVTPELAFVMSAEALAKITFKNLHPTYAYISFGELTKLAARLKPA